MKLKRSLMLSLVSVALVLTFAHRGSTARSSSEAITFNKQVVRLLQQRCQVCHHSGGIGPFSLVTYSEAKLFSIVIPRAIDGGQMPPWKATDDCAELEGVSRLTADEREILDQWVAQGAPEGNAADLPPPLRFDGSWALGEPDVVLAPEQAFEVGLGDDVYRCFSLPTDMRGDRLISAIDVRPQARSIVHHAIVYLDVNGESKRLDDADPLAGFQCPDDARFTKTSPVHWWVPDQTSQFEQEGAAWLIPRGASLVLKIHYHVHHGTGGSDRTEVGLYFARRPVSKQLRVWPLVNDTFIIPAGDSNFTLSAASQPIGVGGDLHVLGVAPHMQLFGHDMQVEALADDGTQQCLVTVEDWDAHWQRLFQLKQPAGVSAGKRLGLTAHYDNSANNPENPNYPPKDVHPGERTTDETCIAFVKYTLDAEDRSLSSPQVSDVSIDSDARLIVRGAGFSLGADILVDGERIRDTVNHKKNKKAQKQLKSSEDWKRLVPRDRQVSVSALNTDGVRSPGVNFVR